MLREIEAESVQSARKIRNEGTIGSVERFINEIVIMKVQFFLSTMFFSNSRGNNREISSLRYEVVFCLHQDLGSHRKCGTHFSSMTG